MICYDQEWARTICYGQEGARKSSQDPAIRFVTANSGPERALRPGNTIRYGQEGARKSLQDPAVRFVTATSEPERATKTRNCGPERATKTRQYNLLRPKVDQKKQPRPGKNDLLWPRLDQKEPPRPGSTIYYCQEWARRNLQDPAVRFDTTKSGPERATKTRQYDSLRP